MSHAKVINIKDAPKGWRTDPRFLFIGRPSYLGNPFHIGAHGNREEVIAKYREHLKTLRAEDEERFDTYLETCVRGSTLVCFCNPLPCHGDVLVELLREREKANG